MVRRFIKTSVARALSASRGDRAIGHLTGAVRFPLVVGYHRVVEPGALAEPLTIAPMSVTLRNFERQLDWIGQRHRFVSLDELSGQLESGLRWREPLAAITFDDGYRDVYEQAFPVLLRKGIPAAIFVVTDWIGTSRLLLHDRLYRLLARGWPRSIDVLARRGLAWVNAKKPAGPFEAMRQLLTTRTQKDVARISESLEEELDRSESDDVPASLRPMTWEMLETMRRAGMIVGSHTVSHPVLTCESETKVLAEVTDSRKALQRQLGGEISYFAYPDGAFDMNALRAVTAAGYRSALTACRHWSREHPSLTIPRRLFWENASLDANAHFSPAILSCLTSGVFDLVAGCREAHGCG